MSIENLLAEIIDEYDHKKVDTLFKKLSRSWVFFFFFEQKGKNTSLGTGNATNVLQIDKENPINIPIIENKEGCFGVIYTNSDLALRSAEFQCKIGKLKGIDAFEFFLDIEKLDSVFIQGEAGNILPRRKDLEKYVANYA